VSEIIWQKSASPQHMWWACEQYTAPAADEWKQLSDDTLQHAGTCFPWKVPLLGDLKLYPWAHTHNSISIGSVVFTQLTLCPTQYHTDTQRDTQTTSHVMSVAVDHIYILHAGDAA